MKHISAVAPIAAVFIFAVSCQHRAPTPQSAPKKDPTNGTDADVKKQQSSSGSGQTRPVPSWPENARAAVSLTYDDGMDSHISTAAPHLDHARLRATFFVNEIENDEPWVALRKTGHELAAHTQHHPCPRSIGVPGKPSEEYDEAAMIAELDADVAQLKRLGQSPPFSFAYPCGVTWFGEEQSYVEPLRERFIAARLADPGQSHALDDLHLVPAQFGLLTLDDLMNAVDQAVEQGRWLVLGFHGIGAGWLITESEVHRAFVDALALRDDVWVAPFGEVAQHLRGDEPSSHQ